MGESLHFLCPVEDVHYSTMSFIAYSNDDYNYIHNYYEIPYGQRYESCNFYSPLTQCVIGCMCIISHTKSNTPCYIGSSLNF